MWRIASIAALSIGCGRLGFERVGAIDDANVDAAPSAGFSNLVAYADQTCALYDGAAYCWGRNANAQLGDATTQNRNVPTHVMLPAGTVRSLAQGEEHGCAVVDTTLYCWGTGFSSTPTAIALTGPATAVDAGRAFTCVIADRLYCFGSNDAGQLGDTTTQAKPTPTAVSIGTDVTAIDLGDDHACALETGGIVRCWGHNDNGAMGNGSFNPVDQPTPDLVVGGVTTLPRIAGWHACNLQAGVVRCWGRNVEGELGDGTTNDSPTPVALGLTGIGVLATGGGPTDFDATCVAAGAAVQCWGAGRFGRLGNGLAVDQPSPVAVVGLPGTAVRELAIGDDHACAALADGDVWCWGRGDAGQLGNGSFANSLIPVRVTPPS